MRKTALILALFASFAPSLLAQTVDEIIQKHIAASGGLDALKSKTSMRLTASFEMQGAPLQMTLIRKRPNMQRSDVTFQGSSVIDAFDGVTRWKVNPFMGVTEPNKGTPEETAETAEEADFDGPFVDSASKGYKIELVGKEMVDGKEAYHLKITSRSGREADAYIDPETYQEVRLVRKAQTEMGEQTIDLRSSDYRMVDGVAVAHSMQMTAGPMDMNIKVDKVEWNVDLPDSLFKMPAPTPAPAAQAPAPTPTPPTPAPQP